MKRPKQDSASNWIPLLVFGATALVYFPVINWLMGQALSNEQLSHAFLVFLLTGVLLATQRDLSFRPAWKFSDTSQNVLILAYILLAISIFARLNILILISLSLSLASLMLFVFGSSRRRFIFSSAGAFAIFTFLATLLPVMDWPLRTVAGKWATLGLRLMGQEVQLGVYDDGSEPMLVLLNNGNPFHVAAECNGFGMLSSCLLMALMIVLYRHLSPAGRLGRILAAAFLAVLFNSIRIILIVLIAPRIPTDHYMLMHEAVGLATTYGGLALLYLLLNPTPNLNLNPITKG